MADLQARGLWGSRFGFILASAGSAIGLGNIWRFPYIAGQNGGAAFVFVYLICVLVIGYPVMIAEFTLGRRTEKNPIGAFRMLAPGSSWHLVGILGVAVAMVIFSWYSVIAGWIIGYLYKTAAGSFNNLAGIHEANTIFANFVKSPWAVILLTFLFIGATGYVVYRGIRGGIERLSRILMPTLLVLLILLAVRAVTLPGAYAGIEFYLMPDFSKITIQVLMAAMGQALFSLSLGMGTMMTYGSYLAKSENIPSSAAWICSMDTGIAIVAGFIILPAVAAMGFEYTAGPGLLFQVIPAMFEKMPGGQLFGIGLFLLVAIAAITSTVSILEVPVAYAVDEKKWSRKKSVIVMCIIAGILSLPAALASGANDFFSNLPGLGTDFLSLISAWSGDVLMAFGSIFTCIFVGWRWSARKAREEIKAEGTVFATEKMWSVLIKFVTPVLIVIIFLYTLWNTL